MLLFAGVRACPSHSPACIMHHIPFEGIWHSSTAPCTLRNVETQAESSAQKVEFL